MMRRVIRRLDDTSVAVFSASDALAQVKAVSLAHEMPEIKPINSITSMSEDDAGNFLHWKEVSGIRQHGIEFLEGGELPENFLDTYEFK